MAYMATFETELTNCLHIIDSEAIIIMSTFTTYIILMGQYQNISLWFPASHCKGRQNGQQFVLYE